MLTLQQFRATRQFETDLASRFGIDADAVAKAGYVYADECYIELIPNNPHGRYYLLIERSDWISNNLAKLEERLYSGWYVHEHAGEGCLS